MLQTITDVLSRSYRLIFPEGHICLTCNDNLITDFNGHRAFYYNRITQEEKDKKYKI